MVLFRAARSFTRKFSTTAVVRNDPWQQLGVPGSNLPFDINNRRKLALIMSLFFCTGFSAPFVVVRHQLLKK